MVGKDLNILASLIVDKFKDPFYCLASPLEFRLWTLLDLEDSEY